MVSATTHIGRKRRRGEQDKLTPWAWHVYCLQLLLGPVPVVEPLGYVFPSSVDPKEDVGVVSLVGGDEIVKRALVVGAVHVAERLLRAVDFEGRSRGCERGKSETEESGELHGAYYQAGSSV